jgi:NAD(P)H dehydrogenase (quinone)
MWYNGSVVTSVRLGSGQPFAVVVSVFPMEVRRVILVTGAAGKTGRAVVEALAQKQAHIRGLVHRPEQREVIKRLGAKEAVVGDLRSADTISQAVHGVDAVYHICPNMTPDEIDIGAQILRAARKAGVGLFVYHSVLHPQVETMPHHWQKMRVEEKILESGLPFVILQPAAYMQNILGQWQQIVEQGIYAIPYSVECRLNIVALEDVGQAVANILTESGHQGATYELCGPQTLSQTEVAAILSEALGQTVQAQQTDLTDWEKGVRQANLGDYAIDTLKKMFNYYNQFGFEGNSRVLSWLLGRPPATLAEFAKRVAAQGPR